MKEKKVMRKNINRSIATIATVAAVIASSMNVMAAEPLSIGDIVSVSDFDAEYYANTNPDVLAAFGTDSDRLYEHFINNGANEGRDARAINEAISARMKIYSTAHRITNDEMSQREKVKTVHDWIVNHCTYSREGRNIADLMFRGIAKCSGYADTFKEFMDVLGIDCEYISGQATNSKGETGSHAWNQVCVDGTWYNIDVCWDDPIFTYNGVRQEVLRHNYFLISNEQILKNHRPTYGQIH